MSAVELHPLPPKEAINYFRSKGFKIGFDYRDIEAEEHNASFTVAKAMSVDLLQDIRNAVSAALEEGQSLGGFMRDLEPTLQAKGWWGRKLMTDPLTGETKEVQLGSPRRLQTIYVNNMRRAYAEGQWDQVQATKRELPYLQYHGGLSHHPRALHLKWNGMVLPADDPWWKWHYPPKEYGCKCMVTQLSAEQVKARGLTVSSAPPENLVEYVNKRTGEVQKVPAGVDPSFNYPMGEGRSRLNDALVSKLNAADADLARNTVAGIVGSDVFKLWYEDLAPARSDQRTFMQQYPVAVLPLDALQELDARVQTLVLSDSTAVKQKLNHPELTAEEYQHVQRVVDRGQRLQDADSTVTFALNEPGGYVAVVKAAKEGEELFLVSFRRMSRDEAERDKVVRQLVRRQARYQGEK